MEIIHARFCEKKASHTFFNQHRSIESASDKENKGSRVGVVGTLLDIYVKFQILSLRHHRGERIIFQYDLCDNDKLLCYRALAEEIKRNYSQVRCGS